MSVRNFWITTDVDGAATQHATGPRAATGGFFQRIKVRDNGGSTEALSISGSVEDDGTITLTVYDTETSQAIFKKEYTR